MSLRTLLLLLLVLVLLLPTAVGDHDRGKGKGGEKDHAKDREKDHDEDRDEDDKDRDEEDERDGDGDRDREDDREEVSEPYTQEREDGRGPGRGTAGDAATATPTDADGEASSTREARERSVPASSDGSDCEGFVSLHSGKDGVIEVSGAPAGTILLRAKGDDEATPVHRFGSGRDTWADHNTSVGKTYTYVVVQDGRACATMETTAVPFFPHPVVAAVPLIVACFALAGHHRRRRDP